MNGKQHGRGYFKAVGAEKEQMGEWNNGVRVKWIEEFNDTGDNQK